MKKKLLIIILLLLMIMPFTAKAEDEEALALYNNMVREVVSQYQYKSTNDYKYIKYNSKNLYSNISSSIVKWNNVHTTPEMISKTNNIYMNEASFLQLVYYEAFDYSIIDSYSELTLAGLVSKFESSPYTAGEDKEEVVPYVWKKSSDDQPNSNDGLYLMRETKPGDVLLIKTTSSNETQKEWEYGAYIIFKDDDNVLKYYALTNDGDIVQGTYAATDSEDTLLGKLLINTNTSSITDIVLVRPYKDMSSEQLNKEKTLYRVAKKMGINFYCKKSRDTIYETVNVGEQLVCYLWVKNTGSTSHDIVPQITTSENVTIEQILGNENYPNVTPGNRSEFRYIITVKDDAELGDYIEINGTVKGSIDDTSSPIALPTLKYRIAHTITDGEKASIAEALSSDNIYDSDEAFMRAIYENSLGTDIDYSKFTANNFIHSIFTNGTLIDTYTLVTEPDNNIPSYIVDSIVDGLYGGSYVQFTESQWPQYISDISINDFKEGDIVTINNSSKDSVYYVYGGGEIGFVMRNKEDGTLFFKAASEFVSSLKDSSVFTVHRPLMRSTLTGTITEEPEEPGTGTGDPTDPSDGDDPSTGTGGIGGAIISVPDTLMSGPILAGLFGTSCIGYGSYIIIKNKDEDDE